MCKGAMRRNSMYNKCKIFKSSEPFENDMKPKNTGPDDWLKNNDAIFKIVSRRSLYHHRHPHVDPLASTRKRSVPARRTVVPSISPSYTPPPHHLLRSARHPSGSSVQLQHFYCLLFATASVFVDFHWQWGIPSGRLLSDVERFGPHSLAPIIGPLHYPWKLLCN